MSEDGETNNVVPFPGRARRGDLPVVSLLEQLLERARAGDLRCIAVAAVWSNGCAGTAWSVTEDRAALVGATSWLTYDLCKD